MSLRLPHPKVMSGTLGRNFQIFPLLWRWVGVYSSGEAASRCNRNFTTSLVCSKTPIDRRWERKTKRFMAKAAAKLSSADDTSRSPRRKKKVWHDGHDSRILADSFLSGLQASGGTRSRKPSLGNQRRAQQLSVILYEYITSLLNTGEICPELLDLGFHVEEVRIASNFTNITVYWLATGTEKDKQIQQVLEACASQLRTALIHLHIMGHIPPIHFSKDLSQTRLQEVQTLLQHADMGPNHEPTDMGADLKSEPCLDLRGHKTLQDSMADMANTFLSLDQSKYRNAPTITDITKTESSSNIRDVGQPSTAADSNRQVTRQASTEFCKVIDIKESKLTNKPSPFDGLDLSFRQDVYSVDHSAILKKILQSKHRAGNRAAEPVLVGNSHRQTMKTYDMHTVTSEQIQKLLAAKKWHREEKVPCNFSQQLLSAHYSQDLTEEGNHDSDWDDYQSDEDYLDEDGD